MTPRQCEILDAVRAGFNTAPLLVEHLGGTRASIANHVQRLVRFGYLTATWPDGLVNHKPRILKATNRRVPVDTQREIARRAKKQNDTLPNVPGLFLNSPRVRLIMDAPAMMDHDVLNRMARAYLERQPMIKKRRACTSVMMAEDLNITNVDALGALHRIAENDRRPALRASNDTVVRTFAIDGQCTTFYIGPRVVFMFGDVHEP